MSNLYMKFLFLLVKNYRKYYLGAWLIKIPFYAIFSQRKAKKWREKRTICYENLRIAKEQFKAICALAPQIKAWIESSKFKEKYIGTNHPYPPLLNPNSINYENIPSGVAWELNIPIPPNYDFIFLTNGVTGSEAIRRFLKLSVDVDCCGQESYVWGQGSQQLVYMRAYDMCVTSQLQKSIFLCVDSVCEGSDDKHLLESLSKKVPILYVARDPISRLKTYINHIYNTTNNSNMDLMRRFNLTCDYRNLFPTFTWLYPDSTTPSLKNISRYIQEIKNNSRTKRIFIADSAFKALHNKTSFVHCVEFDDIKPAKAYDTFCDLSDKFGFKKPSNKELFQQNANYTRGLLWLFFDKGVELYAHPKDIQSVFNQNGTARQDLTSLQIGGGYNILIIPYLYMNDKQRVEFADITKEISNDDIYVDGAKIVIVIEKTKLNKLYEDKNFYEITKEYLKCYIQTLMEYSKKIESTLVNETQILDYLKQDKESRQFIRDILDSELNHIREHYPNFIKKWKYYNEFEKMCVELDTIESNTNKVDTTDKKEDQPKNMSKL